MAEKVEVGLSMCSANDAQTVETYFGEPAVACCASHPGTSHARETAAPVRTLVGSQPSLFFQGAIRRGMDGIRTTFGSRLFWPLSTGEARGSGREPPNRTSPVLPS